MHGKEYYVSPEAKNQPNAQDYCKSHGGRLFEPKSAEVNNDVANFAKVVIKMPWFWIGIHEMESSKGKFVYESDGKEIGWRNWGHEPNGNGNCVTIQSHQDNSHNYWYEVACHLMCHFVCERETDESSYCKLYTRYILVFGFSNIIKKLQNYFYSQTPCYYWNIYGYI